MLISLICDDHFTTYTISECVVQLKYIQFLYINCTSIKLKKERNTRATPKEAEASGITSHTRLETIAGTEDWAAQARGLRETLLQKEKRAAERLLQLPPTDWGVPSQCLQLNHLPALWASVPMGPLDIPTIFLLEILPPPQSSNHEALPPMEALVPHLANLHSGLCLPPFHT